jgi:hypothetical protein
MTTPTDSLDNSAPPAPLVQLLRKEWAVFALRDRAFVLGVFFLASLQAVPADEAFFLLSVALAAALSIYVPTIEWYQETDPMLHSLPLSRGSVVVARYMVALIAGGFAGIAWTTTGRLLLPILDAGRTTPGLWMSLEGGLTFLIAVGLIVSLFFPLYFRFGMGKGAVAFLGVSLGLLVLGYGTAHLAGGPGQPGTPGLIPPSALIGARVVALMGSLGPAGTLTIVLLGTALIFGVSLRLSQLWFGGREF